MIQSTKLILLSFVLAFANAVLFKLTHQTPICLSVDLDAHKTIIIQGSIKLQKQCSVELVVETNTQTDIIDGKPYKKKRQHMFACHNISSNKFMQKFVQQQQLDVINKLRVCVTSRLPPPIVISLSIKDLVSPDFQQIQDQQLSLVSSRQLIELRDKMSNINKQIARMEPMGSNYIETEQIIYKTYTEQKETLNFIVKVQIALIAMIGVIWLLAFNAIRNKQV